MYLGRTLVIAGTVYMSIHLASGAWTCYNEFCPGDNESDYVYTVTDENGKTWYREDGKFMSEEEYKQAHANIIEFVGKDDDGTQK